MKTAMYCIHDVLALSHAVSHAINHVVTWNSIVAVRSHG